MLNSKNLTSSTVLLRQLHLSRAKLRASSRVSALLAGFAMVAIVELQLSESGKNAPQELLVAFTSLACLLVSVHIIAVMISACILPHLDCYVYVQDHHSAEEAPHRRLRIFIEVAWMFSTVLGILLFLAVVVLAVWVKFWRISKASAIAGTAIMIPSFLLFAAFTILFYYALVGYKVQRANEMMNTLDMRLSLLESGVSPAVCLSETGDQQQYRASPPFVRP